MFEVMMIGLIAATVLVIIAVGALMIAVLRSFL